MTEQLPKLSTRNTKQEILDAYDLAIKQIKEDKLNTYNPVAEKAQADKQDTLATADVASSSLDHVKVASNRLVEVISGGLLEAVARYEEAADSLGSIEEAIELKKQELKELTGIETTVESLAAIVEAKKIMEAKLDASHIESVNAKREEIASLDIRLKELSVERNEAMKSADEELRQRKQRAESEFEYEFKRFKMEKHDELADELQAKRRVLADELEGIKAREREVAAQEDLIENIKLELENVPSRIKAEVDKTTSIAVNSAKAQFALERAELTAQSKSEIAILTNKVEVLEASLITEREAHKDTAAKLETAYGRMEKVATASVEGARTEETVNRLLATMNDNGKK